VTTQVRDRNIIAGTGINAALVGKTVVSTLVMGGVVATAGSATIPIGIGTIVIGKGIEYVAEKYDNETFESIGQVLSEIGMFITLNGSIGKLRIMMSK